MKIDILHIIKRILLSDQTVSVPGLGVFFLKRIPAQIDKIKNEFFPPSAEIQFKLKPETRGDRLIQALIDEIGLDKQAALQAIQSYVQQIHDRIDSAESVELPGLGQIYRDTNENMIFNGEEADPIFVSSAYPTFSLDPVVRKNKEDIERIQKTIDNKAPIVKKELQKSRMSLLNILPALFLFMIAGSIYGLYQWNENNKSHPTVELISIDESRLNKKPMSDSQIIVLDDEANRLSDESTSIQNELAEEPSEPNKDEVEEIIIEEPAKEIIKEEPVKEIIIKKPEIKSSASDNCIIIVGAFGNKSNVTKMLNKINNLGLAGYKDDELSRLTRVGVKANCAQINQTLEQIKNQIEPKAWILE